MINKQHVKRQNLDMAEKRKFKERNRISPNSSTKQRHKNQSNQSENSKCSVCGDRDEIINHIISEDKTRLGRQSDTLGDVQEM